MTMGLRLVFQGLDLACDMTHVDICQGKGWLWLSEKTYLTSAMLLAPCCNMSACWAAGTLF